MVIGMPAKLKVTYFWNLPEGQRNRILTKAIAVGLNTNEKSAERGVNDIRRLALEDRIEPAAVLLADASRGYVPDGPRGRRPVLASSQNICKVMGADKCSQQDHWNKLIQASYGDISKLLIDLELTASNPEENPGLKFEHTDIRRGIYIPTVANEAVSAAVGAFLGCGFSDKTNLILFGRSTDADFLKILKGKFEKAFNIIGGFHAAQRTSNMSKGVFATYRVSYFSKPLASYMSNLPQITLNSILDTAAFKDFKFNEVMKYFMGATGAAMTYGKRSPHVGFFRDSKKLRIYGGSKFRKLYESGMLDANPYLKERARVLLKA